MRARRGAMGWSKGCGSVVLIVGGKGMTQEADPLSSAPIK